MLLEFGKIGGIFFDFDGVVADTNEGIKKVWTSVGATYGVRITEELFHEEILGQAGQNVVDKLFACFSIEARAAALREIDELEEAIEGVAISGVDAFIADLVAHKITIALVTGSWNKKIDHVLQTVEIEDRFDFRITRADTRQGKPDPEPYIKALDRLRVAKSADVNALVFEDSPAGVSSALAAGCQCIGICANRHNTGELLRAGAIAVLPNFEDIEISHYDHNKLHLICR